MSECDPGPSLMEALAAGDSGALARAYDLYSPRVYGLALRVLQDPSRAEEVTQDVFVAAWRHRAKFDTRRGSLRAWLLTSTRNRAIDLTRGRMGRQRLEAEIPLETRSAVNVEESVFAQLDNRAVALAVAALPHEQRYAIERAYFNGQSASEIARETGVPVGTVKGRMRLGLQKLARDVRLRAATVTEGASESA